jgi:hypothetical protein
VRSAQALAQPNTVGTRNRKLAHRHTAISLATTILIVSTRSYLPRPLEPTMNPYPRKS